MTRSHFTSEKGPSILAWSAEILLYFLTLKCLNPSGVSKAPRNFRQLPADNFVHSRSSPHIRERYSLRLISDEETSATCAIRQTETRNSLKRFERLRAAWAESHCATLPWDLIKNKRRAYETTWLIIFRIIGNYARWILIAKREIPTSFVNLNSFSPFVSFPAYFRTSTKLQQIFTINKWNCNWDLITAFTSMLYTIDIDKISNVHHCPFTVYNSIAN